MKITNSIKCFLILCLVLAESPLLWAQVGGTREFVFLNTPSSARVAALSGVNITAQDEDVNMFLSNPALLVEDVHMHAAINYVDYLADIQYTSLAYAHKFEKAGMWGVGLQYFNYGEFKGFDEAGNEAADFNARDFAAVVSHSRTIGVFTLGANLKLAQSHIGSYTSSALLVDIGGIYKHPEREFTVGLAVKNVGFVVKKYRDGAGSKLPFDVQIGTTFRPEHMPFRFSITAYNLSRGDIAYYDPALRSNQEAPGAVDKVLRHVTIGTEVLLSKNFNLRFGYNHLVRKELRLEETSGGAGFSMGLMFRIKAFELAYSRNFFHVAGGSNTFSLASDLGTFIKKNN